MPRTRRIIAYTLSWVALAMIASGMYLGLVFVENWGLRLTDLAYDIAPEDTGGPDG